MPKKIVKAKNNKPTIEITEKYLYELADAGTKESIIKLEKYLKSEKNADQKALIQIALDECEFRYYTPTNDKEEDEFYLAKQIQLRKQKIERLEEELLELAEVTDQCDLEAKIHAKVLAKHKDRKAEWEYKFMPEALFHGFRGHDEIASDIDYETAWIAEAKKSITTPRYKTMPDRFLEHYDIADNDGTDDCGCCDDSCDCGCDEEYASSDCGCVDDKCNYSIDPAEMPF
jgi:hypothetical protein